MKNIMICLLAITLVLAGCASWNKSQKGAVIGAAGGGAAGAVIGKASGNTTLGAIIGATVGGAAGAVIGHQMDKQAKEIEEKVPEAKVERVGEGIAVEFNSAILFGFDQSDLTANAKNSLDDLVTILKDYPDTDIEIQGHTDSSGSEEYNQKLSVRRAASVGNYLSARGVSPGRLVMVGYGETAPEYPNTTDANMALNRRVEFLITANEKMQQEARSEVASR
ncbi:MAG: OmpA family protein [Lewinellaceae bacterium]|nr:OmpA family protein [Lewinellaceae bacterium]